MKTLLIATEFTVCHQLTSDNKDIINAIEKLSEYCPGHDLQNLLGDEESIVYKFSESLDITEGSIITMADLLYEYNVDEISYLIQNGYLEPNQETYEDVVQDILDVGNPVDFARHIVNTLERNTEMIKKDLSLAIDEILHDKGAYNKYNDILNNTLEMITLVQASKVIMDNLYEEIDIENNGK